MLLPGMHGTETLFEPFLRALPPTFTPYVVTYPTDRPLGYEELISLVESALPDGEPFLLLGESFGGPLALMAAAKNPPGLRGVVLAASFIRSPWRVPKMISPLVRAPLFRLAPKRSVLRGLLRRSRSREIGDLVLAALAPVRPGILAARARAMIVLDAFEALRSCPVPVLYLLGSKDWIVSRRSLDEILRIRPDVRVASFDAPHLVLQTQPAEAAAAITKFAAEVSGNAGTV